MSEGQRVTLELLIVLGVLTLFISSWGKSFWGALLIHAGYQIQPPQLVLPTLNLGTNGVTFSGPVTVK